jgi:hypothetical protein
VDGITCWNVWKKLTKKNKAHVLNWEKCKVGVLIV